MCVEELVVYCFFTAHLEKKNWYLLRKTMHASHKMYSDSTFWTFCRGLFRNRHETAVCQKGTIESALERLKSRRIFAGKLHVFKGYSDVPESEVEKHGPYYCFFFRDFSKSDTKIWLSLSERYVEDVHLTEDHRFLQMPQLLLKVKLKSKYDTILFFF